MKKRRFPILKISVCFIPLLFSILFLLVGLAYPRLNPILSFHGRIDLSTLNLLIGMILTAIWIGLWTNKQRNDKKKKTLINDAKEEARHTKHRFTKRLEHELKNPLAALQIQADYLLNQEDERTDRHVIEDMEIQLERLDSLVSGLRQLEELEDKRIEFTPVDIENLLQEVIEIVHTNPAYTDRQIRFTVLQAPWKFERVSGDTSLLSLAIYNLLDNALKFTGEEEFVEIRAFELSPWVIIEIADNGSGIAEEDIPFVFEELYRGKNAQGYAGSGLGLAMVKTIIELHGGQITVQSRPQQGTVFSIRLPMKRQN